MRLSQFIEGQVRDLSSKLAGLSHLFHNHRSTGQRSRENDDIQGLGILFEDLANQGMRLANLLELAEDVDQNTEIDFKDYDHDRVGTAKKLVEELAVRKRRGA